MGVALVGGNQELYKLGSLERVQRGTPIILVADVVNGVAESRYSALRAPGAAAGYQVTAGTTLFLTKMIVSGSILNVLWLVLSGTADAGDSQVAAPTGAASEDTRADGVSNPYVTQAALSVAEFDIFVTIATARFPAVRSMTASATLRVLMMGVEA